MNENNNERKNEPKVVESETHSVIPTLLACAAAIIFLIWQPMRNMPVIVGACILALIVYNIAKKKFPPKKIVTSSYESDENTAKVVEVEKKSAMPIVSVGITWIIVSIMFGGYGMTSLVISAVASYVVYQITKSKFPSEKVKIYINEEVATKEEAKGKNEDTGKNKEKEKRKAESVTETIDSELKELIDQIDVYLIEIKLLNDSIEDEFVSEELLGIEKVMEKMQTQLQEDKTVTKRTNQLDQFLDYYMPTVVKILNSYRRIENHELTGENAMQTKKRVSETLPFIRKAFEKELDYMFTDEMLDITTDIDVLESMLSKDGFIDKNNIK